MPPLQEAPGLQPIIPHPSPHAHHSTLTPSAQGRAGSVHHCPWLHFEGYPHKPIFSDLFTSSGQFYFLGGGE